MSSKKTNKKAMFGALALAAVLSTGTLMSVSAAAASSDLSKQIVDTANTLVGTPFLWGGTEPTKGFDSSGLIYYVLKSGGVTNVGRYLSEEIAAGTKVTSLADLQPGDIVFFSNEKGGTKADFGGIYIGDDQIIFSSAPGNTTRIQNINNPFYKGAFISGARF